MVLTVTVNERSRELQISSTMFQKTLQGIWNKISSMDVFKQNIFGSILKIFSYQDNYDNSDLFPV